MASKLDPTGFLKMRRVQWQGKARKAKPEKENNPPATAIEVESEDSDVIRPNARSRKRPKISRAPSSDVEIAKIGPVQVQEGQTPALKASGEGEDAEIPGRSEVVKGMKARGRAKQVSYTLPEYMRDL